MQRRGLETRPLEPQAKEGFLDEEKNVAPRVSGEGSADGLAATPGNPPSAPRPTVRRRRKVLFARDASSEEEARLPELRPSPAAASPGDAAELGRSKRRRTPSRRALESQLSEELQAELREREETISAAPAPSNPQVAVSAALAELSRALDEQHQGRAAAHFDPVEIAQGLVALRAAVGEVRRVKGAQGRELCGEELLREAVGLLVASLKKGDAVPCGGNEASVEDEEKGAGAGLSNGESSPTASSLPLCRTACKWKRQAPLFVSAWERERERDVSSV